MLEDRDLTNPARHRCPLAQVRKQEDAARKNDQEDTEKTTF
jgi:hypothetical protein